MRHTRPTVVLVIAILHFVGGGLGVTGDLCGLALQGATGGQTFGGFSAPQAGKQADMQKKMQATLDEKMPGARVFQFGQLGFDLLLSVFMIVGGIGLIRMKPWGRSLSIVYAVLSLLFRIAVTIYAFAFTLPAMRTALTEGFGQDPQLAPMASMMETFAVAGVISSLIFAIYPIFVLVVMFIPSIAASFRPKLDLNQLPEDAEDEPDLPWGRRRREPDDRIQPDEG